MVRHIVIIQGHPDPGGNHFCNALADAYMLGAKQAGHTIELLTVARLDFPLLRSKEEYEHGPVPEAISQAQKKINQANHLVLIYPLWTGSMPALLKGFIEQLFRPGFAITSETNRLPKKLLKGKSARIVVTMGMPAFVYRWYFCAHSLKSLERNVLGVSGISPIKETLFGMVEAVSQVRREKWLDKMSALGARGQ